jgi:hypothetical protein
MAKKTPEELELAIKKYSVNRKPLTMRQTRLALNNAGLLDDVEAAISNLSTEEQKVARIEWDYGDRVYRNSEWLINIATQLGLTESEIDDLFYSGYDL